MTHQLEREEEHQEDGTGQHGQAQQQRQRLVLADAGELAVQRLMFELQFIQQVLPLGWHGPRCVSHIAVGRGWPRVQQNPAEDIKTRLSHAEIRPRCLIC